MSPPPLHPSAFRPRLCLPVRPRRARATAEFEAIGAFLVLVCIILLSLGAVLIARARMNAGAEAQLLAWQDAYNSPSPQFTNGAFSVPIDGSTALASGNLPNLLHVGQGSQTATYASPDGQHTITISQIAIVPGPTWTLSAYPVITPDQSTTGAWFEAAAQESFGPVINPLSLAPPWQP